MHGVVKRKAAPTPASSAPSSAARAEPKIATPPAVKAEGVPPAELPSIVKQERDHDCSWQEAGPSVATQECPPCGCDTSHWSVLDSLVRTILSQNTTDITSARAFASLQAAFPGGWDQVRTAPVQSVADSIRVGGLADIKAGRIQAILQSLHEERGQCSLEHLRELGDEEAKKALCKYKGVGPKTAACVLMFCMQRDEFPVDTHVLHITTKLGWVPPRASREAAYEHLNACLPNDIKHDMHVLMVEHGKVCCTLSASGGSRSKKRSPLKSAAGQPVKAAKVDASAGTARGGKVAAKAEVVIGDPEAGEEDCDDGQAIHAPATCPLRLFYLRATGTAGSPVKEASTAHVLKQGKGGAKIRKQRATGKV